MKHCEKNVFAPNRKKWKWIYTRYIIIIIVFITNHALQSNNTIPWIFPYITQAVGLHRTHATKSEWPKWHNSHNSQTYKSTIIGKIHNVILFNSAHLSLRDAVNNGLRFISGFQLPVAEILPSTLSRVSSYISHRIDITTQNTHTHPHTFQRFGVDAIRKIVFAQPLILYSNPRSI